MMKHTLVILVLATLGLVGCKKDEVPEVDLGYTYFPTEIGSWVEYKVDSMWRDDPAEVHDSVSYRLLERLMEEYTDDEGRLCQRIHRFVKDENDEWVVRDVWTQTTNSIAAERTEENQRRLKLSFPVSDGRAWDINVFNNEDELEVSYEDEGEPWATQDLSVEHTVLVKNTVPANFVVKRNFEERYADGVGMVTKYWEETNTQTTFPPPTPTNPSPPPIISVVGWRLDMVAVAYGVGE